MRAGQRKEGCNHHNLDWDGVEAKWCKEGKWGKEGWYKEATCLDCDETQREPVDLVYGLERGQVDQAKEDWEKLLASENEIVKGELDGKIALAMNLVELRGQFPARAREVKAGWTKFVEDMVADHGVLSVASVKRYQQVGAFIKSEERNGSLKLSLSFSSVGAAADIMQAHGYGSWTALCEKATEHAKSLKTPKAPTKEEPEESRDVVEAEEWIEAKAAKAAREKWEKWEEDAAGLVDVVFTAEVPDDKQERVRNTLGELIGVMKDLGLSAEVRCTVRAAR